MWQNFEVAQVWNEMGVSPLDAQTVRPARPQRVKGRGVPSWPKRVRLGPSLAAASLDELFEHPTGIPPSRSRPARLRNSATLIYYAARSRTTHYRGQRINR